MGRNWARRCSKRHGSGIAKGGREAGLKKSPASAPRLVLQGGDGYRKWPAVQYHSDWIFVGREDNNVD
ncbi:hypothetical protein PUN4_20062 [Paraburkholderia unamae]|nr:hypothetical protein PUN4_20062 [Paraburkholderia unamae]